MHNFADILFWALNQHCRSHPGGGCSLVEEVRQLVSVARDTVGLATGISGLVAYVRKEYGEEAALLVGALGALGVIAYLGHRLDALEQGGDGLPGGSGTGGFVLS